MDDEFSIAELTDDDTPAVVTLCRAALDLADDAAEAAELVLRLRETGPGRRRTGFVATQAGTVVGVVLGSISHRDDSVGHVDLVAVHPEQRRRGIGRALVGRIEGALSGRGAGEILLAGNAPYYAWPGIDVRYTPAICAATAFGYENDQTAWNMTADLTYDGSAALAPTAAAEEALPERGITVRPAGTADVSRLADFALTHFGEGWAGEITHSIGRDRAGCHLAESERDGLLGFAAYGSSRPSWFGPMGTSPAARGLGIGGVLLRRCLADQRAIGVTRAQIGWVGPVPFYSRSVGARIERVFFLYRKQL